MKTLFSTHNLYVYSGKKIICRDFNLEIAEGDVWGLLGPNGSGKTTLLHTLVNLQQPKQGEIILHGKNIRKYSRKNLARAMGILFQDSHFVFPQTVFDYCQSGRFPHRGFLTAKNSDDSLIVQNALDLMELLPLKDQNILSLSGGERRRLSLATVLAQQPNLFFLDEPTNHLDLRHQIKTLKHFQDLAKKRQAATLMILHDIQLAKNFCNKILLLFGDGTFLSISSAELTEKVLFKLYGIESYNMQPNQEEIL